MVVHFSYMFIVLLKVIFCSGARYKAELGPIVESAKSLANRYDSGCIVLLYAKLNYYENYHDIFNVVRDLAMDVDLGASISYLSFERYIEVTRKHGPEIQCNSPLVLIVHSDPHTQAAFGKLTYLIRIQDILWLAYFNNSLEESMAKTNTPFDINLIIGQVKRLNFVEFVEVHRVTSHRPFVVTYLGNWSTDEGLNILMNNVYNRRNDLEGIVLRTGSTQNAPIHSFEEVNGGEVKLVGYFPEVWKELEIILNFSSMHLASIDHVTGIPETGGLWSGLVGMMQRGDIDVAVSEFIMDEQRSHTVDFSRPLLKSTYQLFFKNAGNNLQWNSIWRPFHDHVWLTIICWIILGAFFFYFCERQVPKATPSQDSDSTLINSAFFITKSLCNQGHPNVPSASSCRIIYLFAYIVSGVLFPSYSAQLISYLTYKTPHRPFETLQGLLDDGTYRLQTNAKTAEYTYFTNATDTLLQDISKKLMLPEGSLPLNTQEALNRVCRNPKLAHFGDMAVASSYLPTLNTNERCDIIHFTQGISTIYSCMAFGKRFQFRGVINHYLQKMEDFGLVGEIKSRTVQIPVTTNPTWSEVEINDVLMIFVILAIGIIIAIIVLALECLFDRWLKCQKQKKIMTKLDLYQMK